MALLAGDADCTTGLSKAIYDARIASASTIGINVSDTAPLKADCYAIATAVVAHITTYAVVTVAAGIPTSAPAVTTGPGTGTVA